MNAVRKNIEEYERVISYINAVQEDVLENISQFVEEEEGRRGQPCKSSADAWEKPAGDVTLIQ